MECPLGHRFFLAGPDRAMDGPMQSSQVRHAVQGLLTRDLPLFIPCRGHRPGTIENAQTRTDSVSSEWRHTYSPRDDVTSWAQLTRIYLAIPAAPVSVRLRPRVRPGPAHSTPIFHLGPTLTQWEKGRSGLSDSDSEMDDDVEDEEDEEETSAVVTGKKTKAEEQTVDPRKKSALGSSENTASAVESGDTDYRGSDRQSKVNPATSSKERQRPGFVLLENGLLWVARLPYPLRSLI